jgi:CheY-like chemotaxis protein
LPFVALVVDDSALIRNEFRRCLQERGYTVATANGQDALTCLDLQPSLIIVAISLSKLSSTEFIREVRHRRTTSPVTVVAVAGRRRGNANIIPAGADHVIFKEVDLVEQLHLVLAKLPAAPAPTPLPPSRKKMPSVR